MNLEINKQNLPEYDIQNIQHARNRHYVNQKSNVKIECLYNPTNYSVTSGFLKEGDTLTISMSLAKSQGHSISAPR